MASGPETRFIASIHKHLPPVDQFYRMKNNNPYNSGIPDCWYSGKRDLWVEYKWVDLPKRPDTIIDITAGKEPSLSALQAEWIEQRRLEGRNVWIIVGCSGGGMMLTHDVTPYPLRNDAFWALCWSRSEIAALIHTFCTGP
jgi:hypothetical protein